MSALTKEEETVVARMEVRGSRHDRKALVALARRLAARVEELEADDAHRRESLRTILRQATENIDRAYVLFRLEAIAAEAREGLAPPSDAVPRPTEGKEGE